MKTVNKIFTNGAFITPNEKKELALENPATGELLRKVTLADEIDTERAIDAANHAFQTYTQAGL
jgi:aldehyde dehydrogenase (NAD+)